MNRTSRVGIAVRLIVAALLVGIGLLYANSAAFHWWLGWGPPSSNPGAPEQRAAVRYFVYAAVLMFGGARIGLSVRNSTRDRGAHCGGRSGFEAVQSLLERAGVAVEDVAYHEAAFGSWTIRVANVPRKRLVWDGKDRWVILEVETAGRFNDQPIWTAIWTGRRSDEQTPTNVVKVLLERAREHLAG